MFLTPRAWASAPPAGRPPRASASTASGRKPAASIWAASSSTAVPTSSHVIHSRSTAGRITYIDTGLTGKRVLITGASGGIGGACARAFAAEGAEVVAHYHRGRERAEALGDVQLVGADLTSEDEVERMFAEAGRLDVCAAVAGVWPSEDVPVWDLPLERWEETLRANLTATFLTARGFLRGIGERGGGSLILVGSTAGIFGEA